MEMSSHYRLPTAGGFLVKIRVLRCIHVVKCSFSLFVSAATRYSFV